MTQNINYQRLTDECLIGCLLKKDQIAELSAASRFLDERKDSSLALIEWSESGCSDDRRIEVDRCELTLRKNSDGTESIFGYDLGWEPMALIGITTSHGSQWSPALVNLRRPNLVTSPNFNKSAVTRNLLTAAACQTETSYNHLRQLQILVQADSSLIVATDAQEDEETLTVATWLSYRDRDGSAATTTKEFVSLFRSDDGRWLQSLPLNCPQPSDCSSDQVQFHATVPLINDLLVRPADQVFSVIDEQPDSILRLSHEIGAGEFKVHHFNQSWLDNRSFSWLLCYKLRASDFLHNGKSGDKGQ